MEQYGGCKEKVESAPTSYTPVEYHDENYSIHAIRADIAMIYALRCRGFDIEKLRDTTLNDFGREIINENPDSEIIQLCRCAVTMMSDTFKVNVLHTPVMHRSIIEALLEDVDYAERYMFEEGYVRCSHCCNLIFNIYTGEYECPALLLRYNQKDIMINRPLKCEKYGI